MKRFGNRLGAAAAALAAAVLAGAALAGTVLLAVPAAWAAGVNDEADLRLKEGPNVILVQSVCSACHSVDYIQTNSVFLDRKGWEGSVTKMINAFGAPITPGDVPKIVEYLASHYGK